MEKDTQAMPAGSRPEKKRRKKRKIICFLFCVYETPAKKETHKKYQSIPKPPKAHM